MPNKYTALQQKVIDAMKFHGRLNSSMLRSWEKRTCVQLTKKGIFEELTSCRPYPRSWVMVDPIKAIVDELTVKKHARSHTEHEYNEAYADGVKDLYERIKKANLTLL